MTPTFPHSIEGRPWWRHTRSGIKRTDDLTVCNPMAPDADRFLLQGVGLLQSTTLLEALDEVDAAHPMKHPGIRDGQFWEIHYPQMILPVRVERKLSIYRQEIQEQWFLSGIRVSKSELVHLLDPRFELNMWGSSQQELPYSGLPLLVDRVVLLADPCYPHVAPFFATPRK